MTELKLPKLPDRTPVKFSITVNPELAHALRDYAALYQATYGTAEDVAELVPFMLAAFIESDAGFKKARRDRQIATVDAGRDRTPVTRHRPGVEPTSTGQPNS